MKRNRLAIGLMWTAAVWAASSASARTVVSDHVRAEWIPESTHLQPGVPLVLGLKLAHAPQWHTYWINPGESGLPTTVEWDLPEGFAAGELQWPTPEWMSLMGMVSFGYGGEIMALVEITPSATLPPNGEVELRGELMWLECADSCIPGGGPFSFSLPVRNEPASPDAAVQAQFTRARATLPDDGTGWNATMTADSPNTVSLSITPPPTATPPGDIGEVRFFPAREGLFDLTVGLPVTWEDGTFRIRGTLLPEPITRPDSIRGVLAASTGWAGGAEPAATWIEAVADTASAAATPLPHSLWVIAMLAFAGGILLNAMPCVFPVISLKILGFVNLAGSDPRKIWRHGLLFAAGVLVSFWALAAALLAIKASVPSIGWGYQLSQPGFVVGMTALFFLLSLNLFGVFELGSSLTGLGAHAGGSGPLGTFLSGVLATLVATPCTGPFMGTAVGVAMTQPAHVGMAIFTALGAGMATPYLLLSRFPQWLNRLPKPGPWMETLKQFMGFLLMGFVLYLVWLFADLRGQAGLSRILAGLLLVALGAWTYGRWGALARPTPTRIRAAITAALLLAAGIAYAAIAPPEDVWVEYTPKRIEQLKASGKPFFIDFTASWCVTCQANKKAVLNTQSIQDAFQQHDVTLVRADWTQQQEPITSALAAFGRRGVPLYVLYPGGLNNNPILLPELLLKSTVLDALQSIDPIP
jgi:thiol:disulfide interchange protein DsbD